MSIMVNGKTFDWGDITISLLPLSACIFSAKAVSWSEELPAEPVYGKGHAPIGYGQGNWKASGSITMLKTEFEALALSSVNGILNMDPRTTTINVLYNNAFDSSAPLSANTLTGVKFTKIADSANQGDKEVKVVLDFLILGDVKRNGKSARGL